MLVATAAGAALCLSVPAFAQQQKEDISVLNERLFTAVRSNDIATVRSVLVAGADPMTTDQNGQTPAGVAIDRGYYDIAHHILGVRNQRQAQHQRAQEDELRTPLATTTRVASAPAEDRSTQKTWRANVVPGQAAEIPSARLSSPQEAVVVTPAPAARPAASQKKGSAGGASANASPAAQPHPAPVLANLPRVAPGAPNPFDPRVSEPAAPPVLAADTMPAPVDPSGAKDRPREPSGSNAFTRFFNGITGVFGGGS